MWGTLCHGYGTPLSRENIRSLSINGQCRSMSIKFLALIQCRSILRHFGSMPWFWSALICIGHWSGESWNNEKNINILSGVVPGGPFNWQRTLYYYLLHGWSHEFLERCSKWLTLMGQTAPLWPHPVLFVLGMCVIIGWWPTPGNVMLKESGFNFKNIRYTPHRYLWKNVGHSLLQSGCIYRKI